MAGTGVLRAPAIAGSYVSTSDSPTLETPAAIDVRVRTSLFAVTANHQYLAAKDTGAAGEKSWFFALLASGSFRSGMTTDGTTYVTADSSGAQLSRGLYTGWFRYTWRASDGRLQFFMNPDSNDVPTSWTQFGSDRTIAIASIHNGTAPLSLSALGTGGGASEQWMKRAQVWNGIEGAGGTLVFDADFSKQADGTTSFVEDASGLTVTVNGSARICNRVAA